MDEKSRLAVEEMPVKEIHTLVLTPVQVATTLPEEDNSNKAIYFVDGVIPLLSPLESLFMRLRLSFVKLQAQAHSSPISSNPSSPFPTLT